MFELSILVTILFTRTKLTQKRNDQRSAELQMREVFSTGYFRRMYFLKWRNAGERAAD